MEMLQYRGRTEEDRLEAAIYYDRIRGMIERMQRTGFPLTTGDVEALNFCIDVLVVLPSGAAQEQVPVPAAAVEPQEPAPAPRPRTGARLRDVQ